MKKEKIWLLAILGCFISCSDDNEKDSLGGAEQTLSPNVVSFDTDQNSSLMFQDNEAMSVMTSKQREYQIAQLIRVKALDAKTIEVSNFAPVDIENATILASIEGKAAVQLFKIKKIRAHASQTIKYPFLEGTTLFLDKDNMKVDLSAYKDTGVDPAKISFDYTGDSEQIKRLKKLSALKWTIGYKDYDPNNAKDDNWDALSAKDIRRFSGLLINMGSVFVSDQFKKAFLNEPIIGNDGVTQLTLAEKEKVYNDILIHPLFLCGKVAKVSGLGGGSTLGYAEHILKDYIRIDTGEITSHEIGHCVNFGHSSNMTYPIKINNVNTGISPVMSSVNMEFFAGGLFIVNIQNYYRPADFQ